MLERCEDRRRRQNFPRLVIDLSSYQSIDRAKVSISPGKGWQQIGEQQSYDTFDFEIGWFWENWPRRRMPTDLTY